VEHLARCVSLATPLTPGTTERCTALALEHVRDLSGENRRMAASMLAGARTSARLAPLPELHARMPGSHPLPHQRILPAEPWAFLAVAAGTGFFLVVGWTFGLGPLLGRRPGRRGRMWSALACLALAAGFAALLGLA
jgi:hypothetical protein